MTHEKNQQKREPISQAEDVEYSAKFADKDDREARERAEKADRRAKR
ncbi:MAG TPA: YfhD family protein [Bacillales bacterium]|nr:YfhD family protein [Bacillales bacterium]